MNTDLEAPRSRASRTQGFAVLIALSGLMWVEEGIDAIAGGRLDRFGIRPRDADGLEGVVTAPFLHGGWDHLIGNTVPFLVLGAAIALAGAVRVLVVTGVVMLVGGLGTWLVAPADTVHIGASGVVFGYAAYLGARGIYSKRPLQLLVGLIVLVVWGGTLLRGLVPTDGISWQGHFFGAVGGVAAAWVVHARGRERAKPPGTEARRAAL